MNTDKHLLHKEKILIGIFLSIFLVNFLFLRSVNTIELGKNEDLLMALRITYYLLPMVLISMTTLILLLVKSFWGFKTVGSNVVKWVLRIVLILIGVWYILLVNNFIGPIRLPDIIATSNIFSFSVYQHCVISGLVSYKGTLYLQAYGIGLYFSIM